MTGGQLDDRLCHAKDIVGIGRCKNSLDLMLELFGQPFVVGIEEGDKAAARRRDSRISRGRFAPVLAMTNDPDAGISCREPRTTSRI
jgi:hypothetical protein